MHFFNLNDGQKFFSEAFHRLKIFFWFTFNQPLYSSKMVPTTLGTACSWVPQWNIFEPMYWNIWANTVATTFTRHHFSGLLSWRLRKEYCVSNKGTGHDWPEAKNFYCYCNHCWGYATMNVEENWEPSWCASCNQRCPYGSVLNRIIIFLIKCLEA